MRRRPALDVCFNWIILGSTMSTPAFPKLRNPLQGVLAGGGVPASAPLLAFAPFWQLLAAAGAASAVAGASLWLAVLVVLSAGLVYGAVILAPARRGGLPWVRNGRGGAGLSEEEFGAWAIKANGAVTFVLYIAAFLVCVSAAVTFLADRFPGLSNDLAWGVTGQDLVAVVFAVGIAWLVNNQPRRIALAYGPATAAVLILVWSLIIAAVVQSGGLQAPPLSPAAFASRHDVGLVIAGLGRLLAIIVGMEVFTTLEPAFTGDEAQRSRKAFGSMAITLATSLSALLFLGPAIAAAAGSTRPASAMDQAMEQLLPARLAWLGTLIAVFALLTVAAASAQALQNLSLGLRSRRFAPSFLAQRNRAGVPDRPVGIVVVLAVVCFLLLGARAEIYLPIYIAGTLLLLVIVAWAAWRRARRDAGTRPGLQAQALPLALLAAAGFISAASALVVINSLLSGAWVYLLAAPLLYAVFHFTRRKMGSPNPLQEELGRREGAMRGLARPVAGGKSIAERLPTPRMEPAAEGADRGAAGRWEQRPVTVRQVAVALDGSEFGERALPAAAAIVRLFDATLVLISVLPARGAMRVLPKGRSGGNPMEAGQAETEAYLSGLAGRYREQGIRTEYFVAAGPVAQSIDVLTDELGADLLVMSTHGRSGVSRFMMGSNASAFLQLLRLPLILLRPQALAAGERPVLRKVLVTLDGSGFAEQVLPWAQVVSQVSQAEILLLAVPEVPDPALYGAMGDAIDELRGQAESNARRYLERTAGALRDQGMAVRPLVEGSRPATTILDVAEREGVDMIMLATHGRGGMERLFLGSVADRVVHHSRCPVLLIPTRNGED